jgi:hypothetical protein
MKLIEKIRGSKMLRCGTELTTGDSCSLVGNSGSILGSENGTSIDDAEDVIRFNNARIKGFEKDVGSKTSYRILNCHYILNILDEKYYNHQKTRFPEQERYLLHQFRDENLIFKTDPSWRLWNQTEILDVAEKNNNKIYFMDKEFYDLGKKLNKGEEPTNGFVGLMLALRSYNKITCYGFSFYKKGIKKHYYDDVRSNDQHRGHDFSVEEKWFSLLKDSGVIEIL